MIFQKKEVLGAEIGCESYEQSDHVDRKFQKILFIFFPSLILAMRAPIFLVSSTEVNVRLTFSSINFFHSKKDAIP